jgi:hypothetical protein
VTDAPDDRPSNENGTHDGGKGKATHSATLERMFPDDQARALALEERDGRDLTTWQPRPRDLPLWRQTVAPYWLPGRAFDLASRHIAAVGGHNFDPAWEHSTITHAELWFVGSAMCSLLDAAAPTLPAHPLDLADVPDARGMVVFQSCLAGIDAEGSDSPVIVGAYSWGVGLWGDVRCLAISAYGPNIFASRPLSPPYLNPLGGCIWIFGQDADNGLTGNPVVDASMAEDRRRLQALWLLSSQPGLATNERHVPVVHNRKKAKRVASGQAAPPSPVRVIQLRHQAHPGDEWTEGGRTYRHRWAVSGHWRNQAFGPGRSQRRPTYINPYLKGPDGAPLLSAERVKAWTR